MLRNSIIVMVLTACGWTPAFAQQPENAAGAYPAWLANSYFNVNVGWLGQSFTSRQLEPGFQVASIDESHVAARVVLVGHEFTPHLAAQLTYIRPVRFVSYRNVNGDATGHSVWTGFGGATLKARAPLAGRSSIYGEAGLGIASRHGFSKNGVPVVSDASHASLLLGAGIEYRLRPSWDLTAGATFIPGNASDRESSALMIDSGFRYTMRQAAATSAPAAEGVAPFRPSLLQVEYTTAFGYSINTFLSTTVPIFWKGAVQVDRGVAVHYDRTVFHTPRLFAIQAGTSVSVWRTRADAEDFYTVSVYPRFTVTPIRSRAVDAYFCYSLAGPTVISSRMLDERDLGSRFTFQDFLGGGVVLGTAKHVVLGVKINHYSNGNLFPENAGVMVPVTFTFGWAF
ncbi:MAG TPA: acyloxyacyl hydrolase [Vicinamibacterales bacterium]